jgi:hypothetical protein
MVLTHEEEKDCRDWFFFYGHNVWADQDYLLRVKETECLGSKRVFALTEDGRLLEVVRGDDGRCHAGWPRSGFASCVGIRRTNL